ncbi:hypothetical protein ACFVSN_30345 [Kitasatospora sp. NPDC057904]|uniref:hypothetical protein n=1 Tax=unclassified Kitasatospora TaxID=2633591 RepID=UPI0036DF88ED
MATHNSGPMTGRRDVSFRLDLRDHLVPALPGGSYRIVAKQGLPNLGESTGPYFDEKVQEFEIRAPQFALPEDMVTAVNPVPHELGAFAGTLPHITLADRLLPWERTLEPGALDVSATVPAPWLALLVFAEEELPNDPGALGAVDTKIVEDLLTRPEPGVITPKIPLTQVPEDDLRRECATIRVPRWVFSLVCPHEDELRYLAHTRTVEEDRLLRGEDYAEGEFAVLLASRLPDPLGGRYVAHLVSLEGCLEALRAGPVTGPDDPRDVRVVSLHRWSFDCLPSTGVAFPSRMSDMLYGPDARQKDLMLRLPEPGGGGGAAGTEVRERLEGGWVPLPYRVESGEGTFAWYRGPLTAEPARKLPESAPARAGTGARARVGDEPAPERWTDASQLQVYLHTWGVFDTSWSVAWSLGRALALADADFSASLSHWRTRARFRAGMLAQRLAGVDGAAGHDALGRLMAPCPQGKRFVQLVADGAAGSMVRALASPDPLRAVPPRGTAVRGGGRGPALRTVLEDADKRAVLGEVLRDRMEEPAEPVTGWLERLRLLHPVPFAHLVPDPEMLPPESLRFFYVDRGWLTALEAGAVSVGLTGSTDEQLEALAAPWAEGLPEDDSWPRAGVLVHSSLVTDCPGLIIRAYRREQVGRPARPEEGDRPVRLLRWEYLAPDILLCLFGEVPDTLEITEPPEGLSFGIDVHPGPGDDRDKPVINLRRLTASGTGQTIQGAYFPTPVGESGVEAYLRTDPAGRPRVLDLRPGTTGGLLRDLGVRLGQAQQPVPAAGPGPAALAVQLANAPYTQYFTPWRADLEPSSGLGTSEGQDTP